MKLLIVDDSRVMRLLVKRTLRQAGFGAHEVCEAENGVAALEAIAANPPDLILCDWNMPEMTGIELLKEMRASGSEIQFGFVTSEGTSEIRTQAADAGALFVLTKPFNADVFESTLGSYLS